MRNSQFACLALGLACASFALAGCGEEEQIRTYEVPTANVGRVNDPPVAGSGSGAVGENVENRPARTMGAMVNDGERTWFFKLKGPLDAVTAHEDEFHTFVKSLKFDGDRPEWEVPDGWTAQGAKGMRTETFHVGDHQPALELTVIPLQITLEGDKWILDNVNRWRNELGLAPLAAGELDENVERVKLSDGGEAVVVDDSGDAPLAGGGMQPPFARGPADDSSRNGGATVAGPPKTSSSGSSEISYDTPEGWQEGQRTEFRKAAFHIAEGDKKALVTVIPLGQSGTLANVNRWRGQIGLEPVTQEQMDEDLKPITVDGIEGHYTELVGEKETILAAIVNRDDRSWFFKLQGDVELASGERERFQEFVKSVKFK